MRTCNLVVCLVVVNIVLISKLNNKNVIGYKFAYLLTVWIFYLGLVFILLCYNLYFILLV